MKSSCGVLDWEWKSWSLNWRTVSRYSPIRGSFSGIHCPVTFLLSSRILSIWLRTALRHPGTKQRHLVQLGRLKRLFYGVAYQKTELWHGENDSEQRTVPSECASTRLLLALYITSRVCMEHLLKVVLSKRPHLKNRIRFFRSEA